MPPSVLPVAKRDPSGVNASAVMLACSPDNVSVARRLGTSQSTTVPSRPLAASVDPSGENASASARSSIPGVDAGVRSGTTSPLIRSKRRTAPRALPIAR